MDPLLERTVVAIAHALFINRLHVLRLTEVVRLGVKPDAETESMELPNKVDAELRQQAIDYVLMCLPADYKPAIDAAKTDWLRPA